MTIDEFEALLLRHGGDPDRWPDDRRAAALAFARSDRRGRELLEEIRRLDGNLADATTIEPLPTDQMHALLRLPGSGTVRRPSTEAGLNRTLGPITLRIAAVSGTGGLAMAGFALGFVRADMPYDDPAMLLIGLADAGHLLWLMM